MARGGTGGPARAPTERALRGAAAEERAARHLRRAGLAIVARNYRCKMGELDLVAADGGTLVFVEVRLRSSERYGGAAGSIDTRKRLRLVRAAEHFRADRPRVAAAPCRFDVVLVSPAGLEWIRDAFST